MTTNRQNAWGWQVPSVQEILCHMSLRPLIEKVTKQMLSAIGLADSEAAAVVGFIFESKTNDTAALENDLHVLISAGETNQGKIRQGMRDRGNVIAGQIRKYITGNSVADVGCGHGLVSFNLKTNNRRFHLFDVLDYRDPIVDLPFSKLESADESQIDGMFDTALLITVLHHADEPLALLKHVWQHTSHRLIVIESIFGARPGKANSPLPTLDQETQLCYAVYCDWFYNRVLNRGVPVPFNFDTPDRWVKTFERLPAKVCVQRDLGVDLNIVPEHHFLFVLDKLD